MYMIIAYDIYEVDHAFEYFETLKQLNKFSRVESNRMQKSVKEMYQVCIALNNSNRYILMLYTHL